MDHFANPEDGLLSQFPKGEASTETFPKVPQPKGGTNLNPALGLPTI